MKIIPFKQRAVDYRVSSRENIKLDGIPYTWSSNLSDEQLREIYGRLLRDRFFVRPPDIEFIKPTTETVVDLRWNLGETEFEYENGFCQVYAFHDHVWVIYRTAEQWEAWLRSQEKKKEARRKQHERNQALRNEHAELQNRGASLLKAGQLKEAEACLLTAHHLFVKNMVVIRDSQVKFLLIKIYGQYDDPGRGLAFLADIEFDDYDYELLAQEFTAEPIKVEAIFKEGIKRSPDPGYLYRRLCIYFDKKSLFDRAIYYCEEAVANGWRDGTKSGFPGRLERLGKHKAKAPHPECV